MGPEQLQQAAKKALQEGQLQRASGLFSQAAAATGVDPNALAEQGLQALESGKLDKASDSLRRTLEANPLDLRGLLGMARIMLSLGQFQEAAMFVSTAHAVDPTSGLAHSLGSILFAIFGDPDAAADAAQAGHELAPEEFFGLYTYAQVLAQQRKDNEAIGLLQRALLQQPEHYGALYLLAMLQTEQQQWKAALHTLQTAQRHHPAEPELYITIADVQWHRQQPQLAIEVLLEGLRRCASTLDLHHKLAQLYSRMEFYEDAIEHIEAALKDQPDHIPILCSLAAIYWQSHALAECIAVADHILGLTPDTWQAHQLKAQSLHATRQLEQAEASYQEAHRCQPKSSEPIGQWAALIMQQNDPARFPQAVELFQDAIRYAPPGEYAYHRALAALFDKMAQPHKANAVRRQLPSSEGP